ncbi:hypothetical protein SERLA73DRAFT_68700 [Serpula lacrymans var. lacrymans S7.3]|uniref:Uncharacterized protein n=2 Tax=Serpula lacrymans var. lacrymans TaxID=341189 RepID=F8PHQ7_SERL3|nr:uncharacterized protein SERLADRAFT_432463 [Serpula lacrymans var. lacrymans S7.9]EGO05054.1 hypothetical protein SERLA73DRAFT_68700 [Serpula lacrymans var. lacrymans S7.3]EGO30823.1 hypothetical protein SERLADRAFT_432463 [Serpula lacrymans var. lacrymans S7.9]
MGCVAKYLSLADSLTTIQECKDQYALTTGEKLCKKYRKITIMLSLTDDTPKTLLFQVLIAARPLSAEHLFHEALRGPDYVDESELPLWDSVPPYKLPDPSNTPGKAQFTSSLVDVMHGHHFGLEKEA